MPASAGFISPAWAPRPSPTAPTAAAAASPARMRRSVGRWHRRPVTMLHCGLKGTPPGGTSRVPPAPAARPEAMPWKSPAGLEAGLA